MAQRYKLTTLRDVYERVPADKLALCMREIAEGMEHAKALEQLTNAAIIWNVCEWIDDGHDKTISVTYAAAGDAEFTLPLPALQPTKRADAERRRCNPHSKRTDMSKKHGYWMTVREAERLAALWCAGQPLDDLPQWRMAMQVLARELADTRAALKKANDQTGAGNGRCVNGPNVQDEAPSTAPQQMEKRDEITRR